MREPGSGTRMTVERFFNDENRVKVEMEIGSNEAIKQAIVLGYQYCPGMFGTGSTKGPLTILDGRLPIQCHWYVVYPASKQLSVVANTFLEYLLKVGTLLDR